MELNRHEILALLQRSREGDKDAFAALFEPFRPLVTRVVWRLAGEELCSEILLDTCLKGWRALPRFNGADALGRWWCRIARNAALDVLRRRQRERRDLVSLHESYGQSEEGSDATRMDVLPDTHAESPDQLLCRRELGECIDRALAHLSEDHRLVLLLREVDDLSYLEIAAAAGISIGTVMSRLFHARRHLRKWILWEQEHETRME